MGAGSQGREKITRRTRAERALGRGEAWAKSRRHEGGAEWRFGEDRTLGRGSHGGSAANRGRVPLTLDVSPVSWWGGFIQCPWGALQPEGPEGGPGGSRACQSQGGGAPGRPGLRGPQTPPPSPRAPEGGDTTLEIRGRSGLHAASEKCNTIN